MPNLVGRRIAGRLVTDVMGMGATAAVYRVRHVALGREEVLRILRDEIEQQRLNHVLPIVALLRDPHVVRIHDLVPPESGRAIELDHPMLLTELAEGRSLAVRPPGTQLSPTAASRIIHQVGRALLEAHHRGIAHGDLKPSNILLVETDEGVSARVTDFGLLPPVEDVPELLDLRPSGRPLFGTPAFLPPERILRDDAPDARGDIYALGLILYELLSGENPMRRGGPGSTLRRQLDHELPPVSGRRPLPGELVELVQRMTARQPELRPASVEEVLEGLAALDLSDPSPSTGRRTITGRQVQVADQFAGAYTEVVAEREDLRSEIEHERTRAALAERRSQRWRGLAVMGFTLTTACLVAAVFALLQSQQIIDKTLAPDAQPPVLTAKSPVDAALEEAPDAAPPAPATAPPTAAPPTAAPPPPPPTAPPTAAPIAWPDPPRAGLVALVPVINQGARMLYAGRTEVTHALWQGLMGGDGPADQRPVTRIEFWEAIRFLNALSEKEGLAPCYTCRTPDCDDATRNGACVGYRLPTSLEWEEIARIAHPAGPPPASEAIYARHGRDGPEAVCSRGAQHGFCDVYGNVWEWTWEGTATRRVRLGGSWMHTREEASMRVQHSTTKRTPYLGLRVVRSLAPAPPIEFAGLSIDAMAGALRAPGHDPRPLSPEAASVLYEGLRAKGEPVTLATLAERDALDVGGLRRGAERLRAVLDELGQRLRLEPAGTDGVRLVVR